MVYPPPPPPNSHRTQHVQHHGHPYPTYEHPPDLYRHPDHNQVNEDTGHDAKRPRPEAYRHPSDAETEAGLALAGLGLGLSPDQLRQSRQTLDDSPGPDIADKKPVIKGGKKASKAGKGAKSCSECRRLKAKCDRQFPCSNCQYHLTPQVIWYSIREAN